MEGKDGSQIMVMPGFILTSAIAVIVSYYETARTFFVDAKSLFRGNLA